jgi:hypothetical protein
MTRLQIALMLGAASVATAGVVVPLVTSGESSHVLGEKITASQSTVTTAGNGAAGASTNGNNGNGNGGTNGNNGNGQTNKQFVVNDASKVPPVASLLYPGGQLPWEISVYNPNNFAISVTSIAGSVGQPTTISGVAVPASTCASSTVRVDTLSTPLTIDANSTVQTSLTVRMSNDAPNGCKNLKFPLTYSGTAVKA